MNKKKRKDFFFLFPFQNKKEKKKMRFKKEKLKSKELFFPPIWKKSRLKKNGENHLCRTTQQQQQRFPLNPIFFSFSSQRDRKKKRIVFLFFLFSIHLPSSFFSFSHWLNTPTTSLLLYCSRLSNYLLYNPADRQRLHKNPGTRYLSLSPFSRLFDDLFSPFGYLFLIIMDDYIYIFFFSSSF